MRENTLCVLFKERPVGEGALVFFSRLTESGSKSTLFKDSNSNMKKQSQSNNPKNHKSGMKKQSQSNNNKQ